MKPLVELGPALSGDQYARYARHLTLPGVGEEGQRRLGNARVLVVGAGGLGSPVLLYLAAAGVGTLGVIDADRVEVSNLQRQVVHGVDDVGRAKVDSAAEAVAALNPHVTVHRHDLRLTREIALDLFSAYDLVIDGADNFPTRYLVSDACEVLNLPCVWGSIYQHDGQVSVFWARPPDAAGVTYRDLHPLAPEPGSVPSCEQAGVLGAVCAAIGSTMALEAVKLITGAGDSLLGRLLFFDGLAATWRTVQVRPIPGRAEVVDLAAPEEERTVDDADVGDDEGDGEIAPRALADLLARRERGEADFALLDIREQWETEVCRIEGGDLVPLGRWRSLTDSAQLVDLLAEVSGGRQAVLYCRSGARSGQLLETLRSAGAGEKQLAGHLTGGVLAWIDDIDPSQQKY